MSSVNHPEHYNMGGIEVIDAIEAWGLGFCLGNAVKYIARAGRKDESKTVEDLEKARWYIQRMIDKLSNQPIDLDAKQRMINNYCGRNQCKDCLLKTACDKCEGRFTALSEEEFEVAYITAKGEMKDAKQEE